MSEAINAQSLTIASIRAASPDTAVAILTALISEAVLYFNTGNNMTSPQIRVTVDLILSDSLAKNLKPEDFRVLFNNAKKGLYGKTFNRIDGQIIFEWIHAYTTERMDFIEQNNIKLHSEKKNSNLVAPEVIEMYKEIIKSNHKRETKIEEIKLVVRDGKTVYEGKEVKIEEIERASRVVKKSPRDEYIQKVMRDFDLLCKKTPYIPPPPVILKGVSGIIYHIDRTGRHIEFEGKVMDVVEYTETHLKRYDAAQRDSTD